MTPIVTIPQREVQEWSALRAWLESDPQGCALFEQFLKEPASHRQALEEWLTTKAHSAPAQISTIISGGHVDKLVNIAVADKVILNLKTDPRSLYQLPPDIPDFTGRSKEVAHCMNALLAQITPGRAVAVLISGMPGVGKSALATRVCHELAAKFHDAQLYLNLRGDGGAITAATDALANLLTGLGVSEAAMPADLNGRAAQYRGLLVGRRMLLLIDNAHSEDQVRPLIPASETCAIIVTSRAPLALEGVDQIRLDVLQPEDGLKLLTLITGASRIAEDPPSAEGLVSLSGGLPLALRIVGGMLRRSRHRPISYYAAALEDEQQRLGKLMLGDLQVRSSFDLSYRDLSAVDQRLFRFLGALPGPTLNESTITCMVDGSEGDTRNAIDRLVDMQLLEPVDGRFRLHDLMRLFARERFQEDETSEERQRLWIRLGNWFVAIAQLANSYLSARASHAGATLSNQDARRMKIGALNWLDLERANLARVSDELRASGEWPLFFRLAEPFLWYLVSRGRPSEGVGLAEVACEAAHTLGQQKLEAGFLNILGALYSAESDTTKAKRSFERSLALARSTNDRAAELGITVNLASIKSEAQEANEALYRLEQAIAAYEAEFSDNRTDYASALVVRGNILSGLGRWKEAVPSYQKAWMITQETNDLDLESSTLLSLGSAFRRLGRWQEALDVYTRAGQIKLLMGDKHGLAGALMNTAAVYNGLARWDEAMKAGAQALEVFREFRDLEGEAGALINLGNDYTDVGRWADAARSLTRSLDIRTRLGDRRGSADVLSNLGNLASRQTRWEAAMTYYSDAQRIYEEIASIHDQALMRVNIANAEVQLSRFDAAARNLTAALPELESSGDRLSAGKALLNLGLAYANSDKPMDAIDCYTKALEIFKDIGDPQAEGGTYHNIGRLLASTGNWKDAIVWYQRDLALCLQYGDKPGALPTLWEIWTCWLRLENLLEGEKALTSYLQLAQETGNEEGEGRALANLASLANGRGDRERAIDLGSVSEKILAKLGLPEAQVVGEFLKSLRRA